MVPLPSAAALKEDKMAIRADALIVLEETQTILFASFSTLKPYRAILVVAFMESCVF
jgi:hypothetical protein